jgi:hypothetical protein
MGMQESVPVGTAEAPPIGPGSTASPATPGDPLTDARGLQILTTEHWSLLATRSLAYNEAFSRAGMFLSFLAASLIVIGFLIGSQGMSSTVVPIAALLLLADLYIGLATVGRLVDASGEELQCVRGMNRIRHAYLEMVPGLEPYFVSGFHDDARGVLATYGFARQGILPNLLHGLTTTVGMVGTIDALILGALCAVVAIGLGAGLGVALPVALAGFLVGFTVLALVGMRTAIRHQTRAQSHFPTPDDFGR